LTAAALRISLTLATSARRLALALIPLSLAGCAQLLPQPAPELPPAALPAMAWDHQPEAAEWTEATLAALRTEGAILLSEIPEDIESWCPGYPEADPTVRAAFWSGLLSALARHESTWNPQAVGGGGQWFGLVQISPRTADGYGCAADTGHELQDGAANLACAVRIAASTVTRDGVVAAGGDGLAADWGPFHNAAKREQMRDWVSSQAYCQG
jgi:hypothetical protein